MQTKKRQARLEGVALEAARRRRGRAEQEERRAHALAGEMAEELRGLRCEQARSPIGAGLLCFFQCIVRTC